MDPVFQRLGDVTIQRLEKPKDKVGLQTSSDSVEREIRDGMYIEDLNADDGQGVKRNVNYSPGPSHKRQRFDIKKPNEEISITSFSDMSDYDSDLELESDDDVLTAKPPSAGQESETPELETSAEFLEKLVQEPFDDENELKHVDDIKTEIDDYDYDIKEKLKEMGEISFETIKKGEKPKRAEMAVENEVVVTPAKKGGM